MHKMNPILFLYSMKWLDFKCLVHPTTLQVTQFLLDKTLVMDEDTLYELSLKIEPRVPPG